MRKIKLNKLTKREMSISQQSQVLGGRGCTCSCYYKNSPGGSSVANNGKANFKLGDEGGHSINGDNKNYKIDEEGFWRNQFPADGNQII